MAFPLSNNTVGNFQDMGQGASGRIASWQAWTADPSPMVTPQTTVLVRDDSFEPILDGSSNGATSGGDNAFLTNV